MHVCLPILMDSLMLSGPIPKLTLRGLVNSCILDVGDG
jgi:hypothetical protein